jgi:hypothetical protein
VTREPCVRRLRRGAWGKAPSAEGFAAAHASRRRPPPRATRPCRRVVHVGKSPPVPRSGPPPAASRATSHSPGRRTPPGRPCSSGRRSATWSVRGMWLVPKPGSCATRQSPRRRYAALGGSLLPRSPTSAQPRGAWVLPVPGTAVVWDTPGAGLGRGAGGRRHSAPVSRTGVGYEPALNDRQHGRHLVRALPLPTNGPVRPSPPGCPTISTRGVSGFAPCPAPTSCATRPVRGSSEVRNVAVALPPKALGPAQTRAGGDEDRRSVRPRHSLIGQHGGHLVRVIPLPTDGPVRPSPPGCPTISTRGVSGFAPVPRTDVVRDAPGCGARARCGPWPSPFRRRRQTLPGTCANE